MRESFEYKECSYVLPSRDFILLGRIIMNSLGSRCRPAKADGRGMNWQLIEKPGTPFMLRTVTIFSEAHDWSDSWSVYSTWLPPSRPIFFVWTVEGQKCWPAWNSGPGTWDVQLGKNLTPLPWLWMNLRDEFQVLTDMPWGRFYLSGCRKRQSRR